MRFTLDALEAAFFDLDGTLIDTREANFHAYRDAFAVVGADFDAATYKATWGQDSRDFITDLIPGCTDEMVATIRSAKASAYPTYVVHARVNRPLLAVARSLAEHVSLGLVTTAKRANVDAVFAAHGFGALFDVVVTGDDVAMSKPSPEPYLKALTIAGVEAGNAVAFEDSDPGCISATTAGIPVVRVVFDD